MREEEEMAGRKESPEEEPESEPSLLESSQWEEEAEAGEDVETLIREASRAFKDLQEGGIQLIWSLLEPREEFLWKRGGNTIRSISLRDREYSEHVELGVCEMAGDLRRSLRALEKRCAFRASYLSRFGAMEMALRDRRDIGKWIEEGGWKHDLEALFSEILSGALPQRLVFTLPGEMSSDKVSAWTLAFENRLFILRFSEEGLMLEVPEGLEPRTVKVELHGRVVYGERVSPGGNIWKIASTRALDLQELAFRPLVMETAALELEATTVRCLWPTVSVVEIMEAISRNRAG